jgi:hypothetical protein
MDSRFRGNDGSPAEDIRPEIAELTVHPNAARCREIRLRGGENAV